MKIKYKSYGEDLFFQIRTAELVPCICYFLFLKGLSHEIDFKNFDKNLQNLA